MSAIAVLPSLTPCYWRINDRIEAWTADSKSPATPAATAYFRRFSNNSSTLYHSSQV